ncbi:uncharacterized protein LOC124282815 isoform X2 [Haliotis rubra]|uniref:uncharacterized protein LOC124282815 isoform X2 n=1 Tax=Haliotis rubra TaxID=36100 RepID=UPI001EE515C1|nr:uncharacterized protein LOC124282815 isoform X2 [Haliotis rubra]
MKIVKKLKSVAILVLISSLIGLVGKALYKSRVERLRFAAILEEYAKKTTDLQRAGQWRNNQVKTCEKESFPGKACVRNDCPVLQSTTLEENLRSVLSTMSERNLRDLDLIMGLFPEPPTGKRTMFVTATSSNHFYESQALIRNLHRNVFPLINNYTFVLYDLGLTASERKQMEKHCRCEVRRFPLEFMPSSLRDLKCYTWKPIIIQANLHKVDILVWMDASVRISNNTIKPLLDDVESRGMVIRSGTNSVGQHTLQVTMDYMKEDVCTLAPVFEHEATFIMFHNKQWVRGAVVKPWAVCAMSAKCMCPREPKQVIYCNVYIRKYHKCHRFDQSGINIILAKLFRDHTSSLISTYNGRVALKRGDTYKYFDELEKQ